MKNRLIEMLERLRREVPGNTFTGTGIVVYENLNELPLFHMSAQSIVKENEDLYCSVLESSLATNPYHDGFNMISNNFKLTQRNVYFSPPIDTTVEFDKHQGYGTRYVAAIMGSMIKGVVMTAVVSNSYGIVIFENGKVIWASKV